MKKPYQVVLVTALLLFGGMSWSLSAEIPALSPLQLLSGDDNFGPAAGNQIQPAIDKGGNFYLVVWEDNRSNLDNSPVEDQSSTDIYAARQDANGKLIDTIPIIISQAPGKQTDPHVVWNGENWLVIWKSQDLNPAGSYFSTHIDAARVSPGGIVIDNPPINVYTHEWVTWASLISAAAGSEWLVLTSDLTVTRGFRISANGTIINPNGILINEPVEDIAFAQDEFLGVWSGYRFTQYHDIVGQRYDAELQPIGVPFNIAANLHEDLNPRVAANGTDFLVGWEYYLSNWFSNPYVARVAHDGQVLDLDGMELADMGPGYGRGPRLAWDGTNWIAAWGELSVARINTAGVILDIGGVSIPGAKVEELTAGVNGGAQITYSDGPFIYWDPYDIYGVAISSSLAASPVECVSTGTPSQINSRLAGDANGWMLVYMSIIGGERRIMARPLLPDGTPFNSEPVELASGPNLSGPFIAGNGSLYIVTWGDRTANDSVYARRIMPDGTPVDASPVTVMRGIGGDVSALGDNFLVVSTFPLGNQHFVSVFGARVQGSDGAVLENQPFLLGVYFAANPRVTTFDDRWLVVWQRHPTHDDALAVVVGAFVNADGTSPGEFSINSYYNDVRYQYSPEVAVGPDTALLVWHELIGPNANWNIQATRLLSDGTLLDTNGFAVATAPLEQRYASVAWDGAEFVLAYEDQRAKTTFFDGRTDVFGALVDVSGAVLDSTGFSIANQATPEYLPSVGSKNGNTLFTASLFTSEAPYAAFRIGLRFLESSPVQCCTGLRGDIQLDGDNADIVDLNYIVNYIFRGGAKTPCAVEADLNSDGTSSNILDLNFLINYLFRGATPPGPC